MTTLRLIFPFCARCQKPFRAGQGVSLYRTLQAGVLHRRYFIPNEPLAVCEDCEPIQPTK